METEKLCPVDKKPCVRDMCMIYIQEDRRCAWVAAYSAYPAQRPGKSQTHGDGTAQKEKGPYKAHLFD